MDLLIHYSSSLNWFILFSHSLWSLYMIRERIRLLKIEEGGGGEKEEEEEKFKSLDSKIESCQISY